MADILKLFNEELPTALKNKPDEAKAIGAKYQMNVTGAGSWAIDVSATGPTCEPGEKPGADCTITIAEPDFQKLLENPHALDSVRKLTGSELGALITQTGLEDAGAIISLASREQLEAVLGLLTELGARSA